MPEINDFFSDENYSGLILIASDFQFPLLFDRVLSIGRNRGENIIIIRHKSVSRRHAKISFDGKNFRIDDIESTNGTIINGQKVQSAILRSGDEVKIGEAVLQLKGELKTPPDILDDAYEDPGMTQILDLDFEKLKLNAKTGSDIKLVEKIKQKISVERKLLQDLAFKDGLTGVFNRRYFDIELKRSLNIARRHQRKISLMLIDIDHFKKFNDTYGHDTGDAVLRMIATKLNKVTGGGASYRYGGEEFSVVFNGKDSEAAKPHLEALRETIANTPFIINRSSSRRKSDKKVKRKKNKSVRVSVSIGVADSHSNASTPWDVLKLSDKALYRAKGKGRNCVCLM